MSGSRKLAADVTVLFTYGTLRRGQPNHLLLRRARFLGFARTLPTFRLVDFGEYPALIDQGTVSVVGELYRVDAATLARLDALEGHPEWYRRTRITLDGGDTAETYVLPAQEARDIPEIPSGDWLSRPGRRSE